MVVDILVYTKGCSEFDGDGVTEILRLSLVQLQSKDAIKQLITRRMFEFFMMF